MMWAILGVLFVVTEAAALILVITRLPADDGPGPWRGSPKLPERLRDEPRTITLLPVLPDDDEPRFVRPYVPAAEPVPFTGSQIRDYFRQQAWALVAPDNQWPHLVRQWQTDTGSFSAILEEAAAAA